MKPIANFDALAGNSGGDRLEPGAYVIRITKVEDNPDVRDEYLEITWDVAEGEKAGIFDNEFGRDNEWMHRFRMYYRDTCANMFKGFIDRIEECNPGYKWDWNEQTLCGKVIGVVFDKRLYTKSDGSDGDALERGTFYSLDYVRQGKARAPKVLDKRRKQPESYAQTLPQQADTYEDIPFTWGQ